MNVLEWRTVSAPTRGLFWCLFPELRINEGNKYQNNPGVSAEMVRHESTYILFLTWHNGSINDYKTTSFTHRPRVSLARFSFCWWRHNRLLVTPQWPNNCEAITWIMVSNSLDIDFIHCDIFGWSCEKNNFATLSCRWWNATYALLSIYFSIIIWHRQNTSGLLRTNICTTHASEWHVFLLTYEFQIDVYI